MSESAAVSTHRFSFLRTLLGLAGMGLGIAVIWILLDSERSPSALAWVMGMGVGFGVAALGALAMWGLMPTHVSGEGLRGWTLWNTRRLIAWDDVETCRLLPIPLFPFVRVQAKSGGSAIWQPLFLANGARFRSAVLESVGEEHALSVFLAKRWGSADAP